MSGATIMPGAMASRYPDHLGVTGKRTRPAGSAGRVVLVTLGEFRDRVRREEIVAERWCVAETIRCTSCAYPSRLCLRPLRRSSSTLPDVSFRVECCVRLLRY